MKTLLLLGLLTCTLSACSNKSTIYRAPDETVISERKDLTLPPDFELRPPKEENKK